MRKENYYIDIVTIGIVRVSLAKWLLLRWLEDRPKSGYELLQKYGEAFGSASPGTIYPLLSQLEEKGLVKKESGKYTLTEEGRKFVLQLEHLRREKVKEARRLLLAMAELFQDATLKRWADYLPVLDKVSPRVVELLGDIELLAFELGEKAVSILEEALERLKALKNANYSCVQ